MGRPRGGAGCLACAGSPPCLAVSVACPLRCPGTVRGRTARRPRAGASPSTRSASRPRHAVHSARAVMIHRRHQRWS